ncbi:MAG: hypothetical protein VX562_01840 [Pseudomonadota bacterium]|nr:hypothetical protein [Pseudomonadota bacterium]|tara:strand:+ start:3206 stop:3463 length:258 start_codon:yes stop_codon:yes gene_type:complete
MDKFSLLLIFFFFSFGLFAQDKDTKISEITVDELTEVVRTIVQETLENCSVTGEMNGRAKINLEVEGEVIARIVCEFEAKDEAKE